MHVSWYQQVGRQEICYEEACQSRQACLDSLPRLACFLGILHQDNQLLYHYHCAETCLLNHVAYYKGSDRSLPAFYFHVRNAAHVTCKIYCLGCLGGVPGPPRTPPWLRACVMCCMCALKYCICYCSHMKHLVFTACVWCYAGAAVLSVCQSAWHTRALSKWLDASSYFILILVIWHQKLVIAIVHFNEAIKCKWVWQFLQFLTTSLLHWYL